MTEKNDVRNVVIIGSGPAGWTAGLYLSRANLSPLLFAGAQIGGQLTTTTEIENFPGFPEGKDGPELMMDMEKQAKKYGTEVEYAEIDTVDFSQKPFLLKNADREIRAHAVIICTGASPRMLGVKGQDTFWSRGVHTCAVCDGGFYRGKVGVVIGGGDSAMEEASYLAQLLEKVYIVHRRDEFRASKIMGDRVLRNKKIEVLWNTELEEITGDTSGKFPKMTGLKVRSTKDDSIREITADAVFYAIGHIPNSKFLKGAVKTNEEGYVVVNEHQETNVEGVYAAGDIHDHTYRQAITAAGYGCKAALEVERYLGRVGVIG
jgi:thioredoxin reductase (NADPH)